MMSLVLNNSAKKCGLGSDECVQYIWFGAWTDEQWWQLPTDLRVIYFMVSYGFLNYNPPLCYILNSQQEKSSYFVCIKTLYKTIWVDKM